MILWLAIGFCIISILVGLIALVRQSMEPPEPIDPVCLVHGKRRSEHDCLYCCLCFENLTPEECYVDDDGNKVDICKDCGIMEELCRPPKD